MTADAATPAAAPAGFWKRYVAYFVDLVVLGIAVEVATSLWFAVAGNADEARVEAMLQGSMGDLAQGGLPGGDPTAMLGDLTGLLWHSLVVGTVAYFVLAVPYFVLQEASRHRATLGKRMVGIVVTDAAGARISHARALGRFLAAGLSWLTLNLGHALAAWTPSKRALHDYLAGTRVLDADPANPRMPVWGWIVIALHALFFVGLCALAFLATWLVMRATLGNA
jgi:uncharacterized RDD family membrane protein YckC